MDKQRMLIVCDQIAEDMENDAKLLDGQPFNGRTVAVQFGQQMAAIRALACILKELIQSEEAL